MCSYFGSELELNVEALEEVSSFFSKRGRELSELNKQQAFLPKGSIYIPNKSGTAPGMWFEKNGKIFMSMPGVPFEMKEIMTLQVLPRLIEKFKTPVIHHKVIRTVGIGESYLSEKIKDWEASLPNHIKLAYLPSYSEVKLRLTASGNEKSVLIQEVENQIETLKSLVAEFIYGYDGDTLEKTIGDFLIKTKKTISVAESCTGGYVSYLLTSIPGSSAYLKGSVVAYHNDIKHSALNVKNETLNIHGAVSEETVKEMAEGIRRNFGTNIGIAITGIAGPGGGSIEKPVGTVWIAYSDERVLLAKKLIFGNLREINVKLSATAILNLLRQQLI